MSSDSQLDSVEAIVDEFTGRIQAGESPSIEEYATRVPEKADELRRILTVLKMMESFAPAAASESNSVVDQLPAGMVDRLGDYQILKEIGHGGMGIVYEAEQISLGRRVALKVLPSHASLAPRRLERFHREARAAAMLHHSNIVPVFGVGEDNGLAYYAMQYIHGLGLDSILMKLRELRGHELSTSGSKGSQKAEDADLNSAVTAGFDADLLARSLHDRQWMSDPSGSVAGSSNAIVVSGAPSNSGSSLSGSSVLIPSPDDSTEADDAYFESVARIGEQVADALHYAHSQGVFHRDIKPSNLLLDSYGHVWVTDFGLAKSLDENDLTQTGELVGTLRYLPPEQFQGKSDGRSDIYSLGLTLYEMATLNPAFDASDRTELIIRVSKDVPTAPRRIEKKIPRDLETIILKAIARDPSDRYQTAAELRDDMSRFLKDEPIKARRESAWEALNRWRRRSPEVATALGVVFAISFAALVCITWMWNSERKQRQRAETAEGRERTERIVANNERDRADDEARRAEMNFQQALKAMRQITVIGESRLHDVPGMERVRQALLMEALRFYKSFLEQNKDDPTFALETIRASSRAARINIWLDQPQEAEKILTAIEPTLNKLPNDTMQIRRELAGISTLHGEIHSKRNELAKSEAAYRKSLTILEGLMQDAPENTSLPREFAQIKSALAFVLRRGGRAKEAHELIKESVAIIEKAMEQSPGASARVDSAGVHSNLASSLSEFGEFDQAIAEFEAAIATMLEVHEQFPGVPRYRFDLQISYRNLGEAYRNKALFSKAEAAFDQSLPFIQGLVDDFPTVPKYKIQFAELWSAYSRLFSAMRRTDEARNALEKQVTTLESLEVTADDRPYIRTLLAQGRTDLGRLLETINEPEKSIEILQLALKDLKELIKSQPEISRHKRLASVTLTNIAGNLENTGKLQLAEEHYEQALDMRLELVEQMKDEPEFQEELAAGYHNLGFIATKRRQKDRAIDNHRRALAIRQEMVNRFPDSAAASNSLAISYNALANLGLNAIPNYRKATGIWENLVRRQDSVPEYASNLAGAHYNLALTLNRDKRPEATRHFERAQTHWRKLAKEYPDVVRYRVSLARVTQSWGLFLGNMTSGRREAIKKYQEALSIIDSIENPSEPLLNLKAGTLSNMGLAHSRVGDREEAERLYARAIEILRKLNPQASNNLMFLANVLQNRAILQRSLKNNARAAEFFDEALVVRREAVARFPQSFNLKIQLAGSYSTVSDFFWRTGEKEKAIELHRKYIDVYEELSERNPADGNFQYSAARSYERLSNRLLQMQDGDASVAALRSAKSKLDQFAQLIPTQANRQRQIDGWMNLVRRLSELEKHDEALAEIRNAMDERRQLADRYPGSETQISLSNDQITLSRVLAGKKKYKDQEKALRQAVAILETTPEERMDAKQKAQLFNAFSWLADFLIFCEDSKLRNSEEAVGISRRLVERKSGEGNFRVLLGTSLYRHGEFEEAEGVLEKAIQMKNRIPEAARYVLAMVYWKNDKREKAKALVEQTDESLEAAGTKNTLVAQVRAEAHQLIK